DEIREENGGAGRSVGVEEVFLLPSPIRGPGGGAGPEIESGIGVEIWREFFAEEEAEGTVAGADFEDAVGGGEKTGKLAGEPAEVSHEEIDEPEIAAVGESVGMVFRERVEDFGLDGAMAEFTVFGGAGVLGVSELHLQ